MIGARAEIDSRNVLEGLRRLERAGQNLRPLFVRLRAPLRADLQDHAKRQSSEEGSWPKRADATIERRPKAKRRRLLGKLPRATVIKADRQALVAENKVPWSGIHNVGGGILPARPFVFISGKFLEQAAQAIADHMVEIGWERA